MGAIFEDKIILGYNCYCYGLKGRILLGKKKKKKTEALSHFIRFLLLLCVSVYIYIYFGSLEILLLGLFLVGVVVASSFSIG